MSAISFSRFWMAGAMILTGSQIHAAEVERIPLSGKIHWVYSYADGQRQARETGKPMFVVFRCER
jgi:hypothetical protein